MLQTELTGAGILEPLLRAEGTTDVLVTGARRGVGRRWKRVAAQLASGLPTRLRCGGWRSGWRLSAGRRLDDAQPWVDGQLTGVAPGSSASGCTRCCRRSRSGGTCLSLRVLRPATQDLAALTRAGAIAPEAARTARRDHRRAAGVPGVRRHRRGKDDAAGGGAGRGVRGASASSASRTPPSCSPRHPHLVNLVARCANVEGRRRGDRARPRQAGVADAAGPHRRRRGARRRGRRPARRAQHRPRRRRGHGAREQSRPRCRPGSRRSPRWADWTAPRCTVSSPPRCRWCCTSVATRQAMRRLNEIAVLRRDGDGMVGVAPLGTPTADSEAAPTI